MFLVPWLKTISSAPQYLNFRSSENLYEIVGSSVYAILVRFWRDSTCTCGRNCSLIRSLNGRERLSGEDAQEESSVGKPKYSAFRKEQQYSHTKKVTLVGEADAVNYEGNNYSGENAAVATCKYVVGVYDDTEGTLKLMDAGAERVFRMTPKVHGVSYAPPEFVPPTVGDGSREEQIARAQNLVKSFGRENIRRKNEERKVNRLIKGENVSAPDAVKAGLSAAAAKEATNDDIYKAASENRNIPPHEKDATTPEAAYLLDKIIISQEQKGLQYKEVMKAATEQDGAEQLKELNFCEFVIDYLPLVAKYKSDKKKLKQRAMCLAYLDALLKLHRGKRRLGKKEIEELGLHYKVVQPMLAKFCEVATEAPRMADDILDTTEVAGTKKEQESVFKTYQRSGPRSALLLCYILLMCLMLHDYHVELAPLALEFEMQPKDLSNYFRELGCTVSYISGSAETEEKQRRTHYARLLHADSRQKTLEEMLPDRRPRPGRSKK
ncbi:hypothetical protein CYMTET_40306 [Cymbomonas tetramitiformis]|uniref:Uncharacterized protein n=1 Tax=Cymbomonas tetramitiformis TaxID=36881 RepID=A0AAE0C9Q4_9CHLO|nr:hypothetical protein CYMTET_40306 [Cymbomonas tetramitiformis]